MPPGVEDPQVARTGAKAGAANPPVGTPPLILQFGRGARLGPAPVVKLRRSTLIDSDSLVLTRKLRDYPAKKTSLGVEEKRANYCPLNC